MTKQMTIAEYHARVGTSFGASDWYLIDQARIDEFAKNTKDFQFIHIDMERAKDTPFGTTIAHGFLTLSMLSAMFYDVVPKMIGSDSLRLSKRARASAATSLCKSYVNGGRVK